MSSPVARERMLDGLRRRNPEVLAAIARRSLTVATLKKALPVAAALLLVALVVAPIWHSGPDANRVTYHVQSAAADDATSRMQGAQYHGTDQQGQPFTLTADSANDQGSDDVALVRPEGDITLKSGAWLMLKSDTGLYHQTSKFLHLNGNVTLYRNDGTTMNADQADIDLQAGKATSSSPVQVQGPLGTLNAAHGFVAVNRGTDITFNGPATMTLTQAQ
jgi:lipopolysaccharide export system protein LptC